MPAAKNVVPFPGAVTDEQAQKGLAAFCLALLLTITSDHRLVLPKGSLKKAMRMIDAGDLPIVIGSTSKGEPFAWLQGDASVTTDMLVTRSLKKRAR